jgi:hypothetical protein
MSLPEKPATCLDAGYRKANNSYPPLEYPMHSEHGISALTLFFQLAGGDSFAFLSKCPARGRRTRAGQRCF